MAIKRYSPKYKNLPRLQQPFWMEKRRKIRKFSKLKWDRIKKLYFPKKVKSFVQDSSACRLGDAFGHDRSFRLKKTYKFLLASKQRFQKHFGEGRVKFYQVKKIARCADNVSKLSATSSSRIFHAFLETRLEIILYRLGITTSLMQARRLLSSGMVQVNNRHFPSAFGFKIQTMDSILLDPAKLSEILDRYLKINLPIFYFRKKKKRKASILRKIESSSTSFTSKQELAYFTFLTKNLSPFSKKNF